MMDYQEQLCVHCDEHTVIYHQYVADARCESCGEWQEEEETKSEFEKEVDTA
jgi:hypothetical protein